MESKHRQKAHWGRYLWACRYFVGSSGNVTDEVIQEYIRQLEGTEPDDGGDPQLSELSARLQTGRL